PAPWACSRQPSRLGSRSKSPPPGVILNVGRCRTWPGRADVTLAPLAVLIGVCSRGAPLPTLPIVEELDEPTRAHAPSHVYVRIAPAALTALSRAARPSTRTPIAVPRRIGGNRSAQNRAGSAYAVGMAHFPRAARSRW